MNIQDSEKGKIYLKYDINKKYTKIKQTTSTFKALVKKIKLECHHNIVLLNRKNANKIENAIKQDKDSIEFARQMYEALFKGKTKKYVIEKLIKNNNRELTILLRLIDIDNSTNVWRYSEEGKDAFKEVVKYIIDKKNCFFDKLKNKNIDLPDELLKKARKHKDIKSFCSKVCKFLNDYIYNNDGYYINDTYVRRALPFYLKYYGISQIKVKGNMQRVNKWSSIDNLSYADLHKALDILNKAANQKHKGKKIKKSELDLIMWYCYKSFDT